MTNAQVAVFAAVLWGGFTLIAKGLAKEYVDFDPINTADIILRWLKQNK